MKVTFVLELGEATSKNATAVVLSDEMVMTPGRDDKDVSVLKVGGNVEYDGVKFCITNMYFDSDSNELNAYIKHIE